MQDIRRYQEIEELVCKLKERLAKHYFELNVELSTLDSLVKEIDGNWGNLGCSIDMAENMKYRLQNKQEQLLHFL